MQAAREELVDVESPRRSVAKEAREVGHDRVATAQRFATGLAILCLRREVRGSTECISGLPRGDERTKGIRAVARRYLIESGPAFVVPASM
jgi:hypothetical protein